ncbi:hypothetical protein NEMBOFW57_008574 [Staphylotrichum longicolle]|uniref:Uncharacterized protein n=1 Tax=Staphylotrichum longicolle TaxID=669026 RepID=A0AAD4ERX3_9PEZI|nr:hypothetical protein NEMBOFW57_008574 [Staphylotrichum longicolle]
MARVMLGNSADAYGGCEQESFVKGYEKGFDAGWGSGFAQAFEEGKMQGRRELEDEIQAAERIRKAGGAVCLLSDAPRLLKHDAADTSSINEEDVYYATGGTAVGPETSTSMEVCHDAGPHRAASTGECNGNNTSSGDLREPQAEGNLVDFSDDTEQDPSVSSSDSISLSNTEPRAESPTTSAASVRGQADFDVFYDSTPKRTSASNNVSTPSGALVLHSATLIDLTTPSTDGTPTPAPRGFTIRNMTNSMAEIMTQRPVDIAPGTAPGTITNSPAETTPDTMINALVSIPETTTTTSTSVNTTTNTASPALPALPSTLYNIPLAHTITPITPDLTLPPQHFRPRPAYPTLAGAYNIHSLAARGATVVENPWRVLVGPLSPAAREAWKGDAGKGYLRVKLGRGGNGYPRAGRCSGARWDDGGVVFCEMVHDETEETAAGPRWYVLAMFESQERAAEAVRVFQGFAW